MIYTFLIVIFSNWSNCCMIKTHKDLPVIPAGLGHKKNVVSTQLVDILFIQNQQNGEMLKCRNVLKGVFGSKYEVDLKL